MRLMQLIYASRPFGFDAGMLDDILLKARHNNGRDGVTGALICRHDIFLQLLEGPRPKVTAAFGRILRDDRHVDVALLWAGDAACRSFPDWTMRDDPVDSWMWTPAQLRDGGAADAPSEEARQVFARLAAQPRAA